MFESRARVVPVHPASLEEEVMSYPVARKSN